MKNDNQLGSVRNTFRIIETIFDQEPIGVTELAEELEMPKSTVFSHLNTLSSLGYIYSHEGEYNLSLRFLEIGKQLQTRRELFHVARPEIIDLAAETTERTNLLVEENGEGVYLFVKDGEQAVELDTQAGSRVDLYNTALGKAILAHLPKERLDSLIEDIEFKARTENTITSESELRKELEEIESNGFALDDQERATDLRCVAAPILVEERPLGAISVAGPVSRIKGDRFHEKLPEMVRSKAQIIGINATYGDFSEQRP